MTHTEIREMIRERVAERLKLAPGDVGLQETWEELGLDSLEAANMSGEIEKRLGRRIDPAALWDHPTVWDLSVYLAELMGLETELPEDEEELNQLLEKLKG